MAKVKSNGVRVVDMQIVSQIIGDRHVEPSEMILDLQNRCNEMIRGGYQPLGQLLVSDGSEWGGDENGWVNATRMTMVFVKIE